MYRARMNARQCITVSGVKTLLFLLITTMANGGEWGVDTLGSELFPTCLPLRLASRGPSEVLSYLLDKFRERLSMEQLPLQNKDKDKEQRRAKKVTLQ